MQTNRPASFNGDNILIVEDDPFIQHFIITLLKRWNLNTDISVNGKDAIQCLKRKDYTLVLMDIEMPVMNGTEATRYIREEISPDIPIIAVSAAKSEQDVAGALHAGMNDYIRKPFRAATLFSVISRYIPAG